MKALLRQCAYLLFFITAFAFMPLEVGPPAKLRKAYEALEVYNYFAAREAFYKLIDKYKAPSAYGLSVIYGRDDNPFTDIDSAFKYVRIAHETLPSLDEKTMLSYAPLGFDSAAVASQLVHVDSLAFLRAAHQGSPEAMQAFIDAHYTPRFIQMAIAERDGLAFELADEEGTAAAFAKFMETYPEAEQYGEARERYDELLYKESTASGRIRDYQRFLETNPESPYREEAEYAVYSKFTASGTALIYKQFIDENPGNSYVKDAWRQLYVLEIGDSSPRSMAAFTLRYPDYPFLDELKSDFDLITTSFYAVRDGNRWGFIDAEGNLRIAAQYEWTEPFSEGIAMVGKDDKAIYIDKRGQPITRKTFEDGTAFRQGFAVVDFEGLQGVINRLGAWILKPEYEVCGEHSEGFFYAEKNGLYGYANRRGEIAIPFGYTYASDFEQGRAVVGRNDKLSIIDTLGKALTAFEYDWIDPFTAQPGLDGKMVYSRMRKEGVMGLIDYNGKVTVAAQYDALGEEGDGLYLAASGDRYGFITGTGDTIIDFKYHYTTAALEQSRFDNGHARVFQKVNRDVKIGVIDTLDNKLMPAMFSGIGDYNAPLISVRKQELWGYADREVNLKIKYQFEAAETFQDSLAVVSLKGSFGLIDLNGVMVLPAKFSSMQRLDSLVLVADSLYGILHLNGDTLVPLQYASAELLDANILRFTDRSGLMNYFNIARRKFIWREQED